MPTVVTDLATSKVAVSWYTRAFGGTDDKKINRVYIFSDNEGSTFYTASGGTAWALNATPWQACGRDDNYYGDYVGAAMIPTGSYWNGSKYSPIVVEGYTHSASCPELGDRPNTGIYNVQAVKY
jgi:hypothetical protein